MSNYDTTLLPASTDKSTARLIINYKEANFQNSGIYFENTADLHPVFILVVKLYTP